MNRTMSSNSSFDKNLKNNLINTYTNNCEILISCLFLKNALLCTITYWTSFPEIFSQRWKDFLNNVFTGKMCMLCPLVSHMSSNSSNSTSLKVPVSLRCPVSDSQLMTSPSYLSLQPVHTSISFLESALLNHWKSVTTPT